MFLYYLQNREGYVEIMNIPPCP